MGYATVQMVFAKLGLVVASMSNRKSGEELPPSYGVGLKSNCLHIQPHFQVHKNDIWTK